MSLKKSYNEKLSRWTGMKVLILSYRNQSSTDLETGEVTGNLAFWILGATNPNDPEHIGPTISLAFGEPYLKCFVEEIPGVYAIDLRPLQRAKNGTLTFEVFALEFVKKSPINFNLDELGIYEPVL